MEVSFKFESVCVYGNCGTEEKLFVKKLISQTFLLLLVFGLAEKCGHDCVADGWDGYQQHNRDECVEQQEAQEIQIGVLGRDGLSGDVRDPQHGYHTRHVQDECSYHFGLRLSLKNQEKTKSENSN
jgi:hypothetical protein